MDSDGVGVHGQGRARQWEAVVRIAQHREQGMVKSSLQ